MASFWFWVFTFIGSILGGGLLMFILFFLFTFIRDLIVKRGIPKGKEALSDYIKDNPERFNKTNPGGPYKLNKEQEKENDRKQGDKFREFEKLRRTELKGRAAGKGQPNSGTPGNEELQGRGVLQNEPSTGNTKPSPRSSESRRSVKLDG